MSMNPTKMEPIVLNILAGEDIGDACETACDTAQRTVRPVEFDFNGQKLVATPSTDPTELANSYYAECDRRMREYRESRHQNPAIDEIMDNFDFGKVARAMEALEWKWSTEDGMMVPDEPQLRATARRLLNEVAKGNEGAYTGTGGFMARNLGDGNLQLTFEVAEWRTDH